ncbi:MAG: cupin domain-containing protein [Halobacteriales archaeon]
MPSDYEHYHLDELETNPEKPTKRWELSPQLDLTGYNFNVAIIDPDERLSQNAYHYHENQEEFFYIIEGRCRAETEDGSFDLSADDVVVFRTAVPHLLHNPFDEPCKLVAVGSPPEGRYPVEQVQSYEALLEERYPDSGPP